MCDCMDEEGAGVTGVAEDSCSSRLTMLVDLRDDGDLSASFFLALRVASLLQHESHL